MEEKYNSLTNQNVEEINIARKTIIRKEKLSLKKTSDHMLPLFKGESVKELLDTINHSHIKTYTDEEKANIEMRIRELSKEQSSK